MNDKEYRQHLYEMLRLKQMLGITEDPEIPESIRKQVHPTLKNYFDADLDHQIVAKMTKSLQGKTEKYVFQMSNGSQQIKLYEPHKYKNRNNSPLRVRARMIMHLANQEPCDSIEEKIRELYKTYPYYLLKSEPVNLRLRNFRFAKEVREGDPLDVFLMTSETEPDPETDELVCSVTYKPKRSLKFEFSGQSEQRFYSVNRRNNSYSNILDFIWKEELEQIPNKQ
jgi:hypothetical protein